MKVKVLEESKIIKTYKSGIPDLNPMFLEKRVYQASSGKIYPYPIVESIEDKAKDVEYNVVYLENDYIKLMLMPSLGGRIQYGYDKVNDYYFFYNNEVIKPALVGVCGPWISGGVEFNWPQHHRPSTFQQVQYHIEENDNYTTVWMGEIEAMYSMTGITGVRLYNNSLKVEVLGKSINTTTFYQKFLWWANIAVSVHDEYETFFPSDVTYVADHGKRFISEYPKSNSTYYNINYHLLDDDAKNITNYKNIPVPMSYMALNSKYDFFGGYDFKKEIGTMHIANTHIAPGKKQWTWGNGEFGQAWDNQLTDENGPYIELMAGVYTDNQPDFTWIAPGELKEFTQTWYPFTKIGKANNANDKVALTLEYKNGKIIYEIFAVEDLSLDIKVKYKNDILESSSKVIKIGETYNNKIDYLTTDSVGLNIELYQVDKLLISYKIEELEEKEFFPAIEALEPCDINSNDELYQIALHLEQYSHATYLPDDYYIEALKRDEKDVRCNLGFGSLLLKRGNISLAISYLEKAKTQILKYNPNPKDCEVFYYLGLAYKLDSQFEKAYASFYKAIWDFKYKASGYCELAKLDFINDKEKAKFHVSESLKYNNLSFDTNTLAYLLDLPYEYNKFNYKLGYIKAFNENEFIDYQTFAGNEYKTLIEVISLFDEIGMNDFVLELTNLLDNNNPFKRMIEAKINDICLDLTNVNIDYVFPNRIYEMKILKLYIDDESFIPSYLLALLLYDKLQHEESFTLLNKAYKLEKNYSPLTRVLAIAYFNVKGNISMALRLYKLAINSNPNDAKLIYEYDQLRRINNDDFNERISYLENNLFLVKKRDDLYIEYIKLINQAKEYDKAINLLVNREFHPFEGGEGKIIEQYIYANIQLGKKELEKCDNLKAVEFFKKCFIIPENFKEKKIHNTPEADINYYLGLAYEELDINESKKHYSLSYNEVVESSSKLSYKPEKIEMKYYQYLAGSKLGIDCANLISDVIEYAQTKINIDTKIDYFAISLPELLIFNIDLNIINKTYCNYLLGISYSISDLELSKSYLKQALALDINHIQANIFLEEVNSKRR